MAERKVVKKVENAVLYSDGCIKIENIRVSYPHLDKPYAGTQSGDENSQAEPKYGLVALLPKDTHEAAKDLCASVIKSIQEENDIRVAKDKKFIRDGDDSDKVENEGCYTISAREARRPSVRNKNAVPMTEREIQDKIYGGCWGSILIRPWLQDNKYGKRINASLIAFQFLRDDEPFGEGRVDDDGVFDSAGSDDDDGDNDL